MSWNRIQWKIRKKLFCGDSMNESRNWMKNIIFALTLIQTNTISGNSHITSVFYIQNTNHTFQSDTERIRTVVRHARASVRAKETIISSSSSLSVKIACFTTELLHFVTRWNERVWLDEHGCNHHTSFWKRCIRVTHKMSYISCRSYSVYFVHNRNEIGTRVGRYENAYICIVKWSWAQDWINNNRLNRVAEMSTISRNEATTVAWCWQHHRFIDVMRCNRFFLFFDSESKKSIPVHSET